MLLARVHRGGWTRCCQKMDEFKIILMNTKFSTSMCAMYLYSVCLQYVYDIFRYIDLKT